MGIRATARGAGTTVVVEMSGQITLGEGSALLRKTVRGLLAEGHKHILLNLAEVDYIDSAGIGELVSSYMSTRNGGGELKLLHLSRRVRDVLQLTKLYTVFDVHTDEATALRSFH
jgi:anti-sigma B factor antagonist